MLCHLISSSFLPPISHCSAGLAVYLQCFSCLTFLCPHIDSSEAVNPCFGLRTFVPAPFLLFLLSVIRQTTVELVPRHAEFQLGPFDKSRSPLSASPRILSSPTAVTTCAPKPIEALQIPLSR